MDANEFATPSNEAILDVGPQLCARWLPPAFWRSVGPSHTVFVVESFMDELAAATKQDPVAYRRAILDKAPTR
jgi:CO/xanthine dehydrogenase Mo-binding subunit